MKETEGSQIQRLQEMINQLADEKFKAMDVVEKVSRNNKVTSQKIRNLNTALKKLHFTFEKMLGWAESKESVEACKAALEYINRVRKENK